MGWGFTANCVSPAQLAIQWEGVVRGRLEWRGKQSYLHSLIAPLHRHTVSDVTEEMKSLIDLLVVFLSSIIFGLNNFFNPIHVCLFMLPLCVFLIFSNVTCLASNYSLVYVDIGSASQLSCSL